MTDADVPARERILQAALTRFAIDGLTAPLRRIAADAGVSPGLIIHHFGSREHLLAACDQRSLEVTRAEKTETLRSGSADVMLAQLAQAEAYAPLAGYILRRLQAGGPTATQMLEDLVEATAEYLHEGELAGMINPSRDPEARARMLVEMGMGALLLQMPGLDQRLDLDELPRWMRAYTDRITGPTLELYTEPLLKDRTLLDAYLDATVDRSKETPS